MGGDTNSLRQLPNLVSPQFLMVMLLSKSKDGIVFVPSIPLAFALLRGAHDVIEVIEVYM